MTTEFTMRRYLVIVRPSRVLGGGGARFYEDGETPEQVVARVASDYCDSGSVIVENVADPNDRAVLGRR